MGTDDGAGPIYVKWCSVCMEFRRALPEEEVCPVCGAVFRKNQCYRCGHTWRQRKDTPPGTCPSCRSPFWNRLYMRPEHSRKQKQW